MREKEGELSGKEKDRDSRNSNGGGVRSRKGGYE